ncbi:MAG: thioredoxin family protein [Sandaracinaceae bacterium]
MRRRALAIVGTLGLAAGAAVAIGALGPSGSTSTARADGVAWTDHGFDAALTEARERDALVFLKFEAEWCTYCRQLDAEILSTVEGAALTEGLVPLRLDFDDRANRPLVERYVVLSLPAVLVLTGDGTLVGRVDGYESHDEWIHEARTAVAAEDPLPALRAAHEADPDDPAAAFALGDGLLTHGYPEDGLALLEETAFMEGPSAAEALFILGRYRHRVEEDPAAARPIWRELATRFPHGEHEAGALFWYARAEAELGHPERGLAVLERHARREATDVEAASLVAQFFERYEVDGDRAGAAERLRGLLDTVEDPDERAELAALAERLGGPR